MYQFVLCEENRLKPPLLLGGVHMRIRNCHGLTVSTVGESEAAGGLDF